jgi:hypothetical protein
MKKTIPLFLILLTLVGCSAKIYTPVINTEFELNAVYQTGDFSYNCEIVKNEDFVSVTPTSTNASGMIITYDGKNVTFNRNDMVKSISADEIVKTNPAVVIYEVFNYIETFENLDVQRIDNKYQYTGKTSLGNFILVQNDDNSIESIEIPTYNIIITTVTS